MFFYEDLIIFDRDTDFSQWEDSDLDVKDSWLEWLYIFCFLFSYSVFFFKSDSTYFILLSFLIEKKLI